MYWLVYNLLLDAAGNAPVLDDGEAGVGDVELQRHLRHPHRELGLACAWSLSLPGSIKDVMDEKENFLIYLELLCWHRLKL